MLHVSGAPNPMLADADGCRCMSFAEAEARGLSISELRERYGVAVEAFPDRKDDLAKSWTDLQYTLRDRLQEASSEDLGGHSFFSVVIFDADGRIAWVFHRGLEQDEEHVFCKVVEDLAEDYRFPLRSDTGFSQCGTTHFAKK